MSINKDVATLQVKQLALISAVKENEDFRELGQLFNYVNIQ